MKMSWMAACLLITSVAAPAAFGETTLPTALPQSYGVVPVAHHASGYDYYGESGDAPFFSPVSDLQGGCTASGCAAPGCAAPGCAVPICGVAPGGCGAEYGGCADCASFGCCCDDRLPLLPFIRRGDHCYDGFISPMTNPVFFEDPRNVTEARMIFLNHQLPPGLGSGDVQVYAMQIRASLTDRLSLIATKDGFIVGGNDAPLMDGWADISAGLKYLLFADPQSQRLLSTGFTFELPVGSIRSLQGNGDGELNLFMTGGTQIGYDWHWISAGGVRLPMNTLQEAPVMYWSNHIDRRLIGDWYFLTEFNWYNYLKDGRTAFTGINGIDLFNLGGTSIAGNNIVTGAFGTKWKPAPWTELGVAWELPLSSRKDLLEHRLTADWIIRF